MSRLSLEEVFDLPYPSILAYLRSKDWNLSQEYENDLITAIIFYNNDYLLREEDRQIVRSSGFVTTFRLSNTKVIQMMSDKEDVSIFTTKAEIIRSLLRSTGPMLGELMTFGDNEFGQFRSYRPLVVTSESI